MTNVLPNAHINGPLVFVIQIEGHTYLLSHIRLELQSLCLQFLYKLSCFGKREKNALHDDHTDLLEGSNSCKHSPQDR